jgi:hypothetical protein
MPGTKFELGQRVELAGSRRRGYVTTIWPHLPSLVEVTFDDGQTVKIGTAALRPRW